MTPLDAVLAGLGLHLLGGLVPLAGGRRAAALGTALGALGSALGLAGVVVAIPAPAALASAPWAVPGGALLLRLDALSAAFLAVIFAVSGLGTVYGLGYGGHGSSRSLRLFFGLMTVGLGFVVLAANGVLFLVAWEVMALAAFFLVAADSRADEVRRAAWSYLVATHVGTACLVAAFALLSTRTGSFSLPGAASGATASAVFLLGLVGFGMKAGLVPFHFWLPAAHANAPSHVSALMSGVMLKAGVYGILRFSALADVPPLWWGLLLATLGAVSAVTGIALASGQSDLKRALAYSSIENVGIIALGIGLALVGRTLGRPAWIALGFGGALFHVFAHAGFKSLLFLGSGSVLHAAGTRNMDRLGGLARTMPVTSGLFVVGALAASGLPLLSGFVGEWLIALGLFETLRDGAAGPVGSAGGWALAFGAPALALAGALALASFVRIVGSTFLGTPRSEEAARAHESPRLMTAPMGLLAAVCLALGLFPGLLVPALAAAQGAWLGRAPATDVLADALTPSTLALALLAAAVLTAGAALAALLPRAARREPTWDCGYAAGTSRIQYTSTSFGDSVARGLPEVLRPASRITPPAGLLPGSSSFRTEAPDPFAHRLYEPFAARWAVRLGRLRRFQGGQLSTYLVYVFVTTLATLAWSVVRPYVR